MQDKIDVRPRASSYYGNGAGDGKLRAPEGVGSVTTKYRYCQPDPIAGVVCDGTTIADEYAEKPEGPPDPARPFHKVHMIPNPGSGSGVDNEPLVYDPGVPPTHRQWKFDDDRAAWVAAGWIQDASLNGRFWVHAATTKGRFLDQVPASTSTTYGPSTTGYRVNDHGVASAASDADGSNLANHYVFLEPSVGKHSIWSRPLEPALFIFFKVCEILPAWDGVAGEASPLVSLEGEDEKGVAHFGVVLRNGTVASANDVLSSSLRARLAGTYAWASGAEVMLAQGKSGFHALVFASDGTRLVDVVARTPKGLGVASDIGFAVPTATGPAARTEFVPVYSRVEDLAFVVGGKLTSTGGESREIWWRQVRGSEGWTLVPALTSGRASLRLEHVLAATYSFRDEMLWVLDDDRSRRRLLRIDPFSGNVDVVGTWTVSSAFTKQWLVLDLDGNVVLASSSPTAFGIARFQSAGLNPTVTPTIVNFEQGARALLLAPAVDALGSSILTRVSSSANYVTERRTDFQGTSAAISALDAVL